MSANVAIDRGGFLSGSGTGERDYNHVSDSEYKNLRSQADQAYKKKKQFSSQSQEAYKAGDGARAKQLSEQAKQQQAIADDYNFRAAKYVFIENNADSDGDEIDLHGLYIKEAEHVLKTRIVGATSRSEPVLKVIVGKGLHSKDGVAKLKPAVEELCNEAGLHWRIDPKNAGVLEIDLKGARAPQAWYQLPTFDQPSKPSNAYVPQGQPQYQQHHNQNQQYNQQPQYQQYNQQQQQHQNNNNNNNGLSGLLTQLLCICIKNLK